LALPGRRTHQLDYRRPNVALLVSAGFIVLAGNIHLQTDTECRLPILTVGPVRSDELVVAEKCERQMKIHSPHSRASIQSQSLRQFARGAVTLR
jgi:hypothetical protein